MGELPIARYHECNDRRHVATRLCGGTRRNPGRLSALSHVRAKSVSFWRGIGLRRIVDIGPTATVLRQHRATVGDATMSSFTLREKLLAGSILVGIVAAAPIA